MNKNENDTIKLLIANMLDDDFWRFHISSVIDSLWNVNSTKDYQKAVEVLLKTVKNDDKEETLKYLIDMYRSPNEKLDDEYVCKHANDLLDMIYRVRIVDLIYYYYLKDSLSEEEVKNVNLCEILLEANPKEKQFFEELKHEIVIFMVNRIERSVNEYTIRMLKSDIFEHLNKQLEYEDSLAAKNNSIVKAQYFQNSVDGGIIV